MYTGNNMQHWGWTMQYSLWFDKAALQEADILQGVAPTTVHQRVLGTGEAAATLT